MKKYISSNPHAGKAIGMEYSTHSVETVNAIRNISMDIYIDMVNAGHSLQETVAAIYYSGIVHAIKLPKYRKIDDDEKYCGMCRHGYLYDLCKICSDQG